MTFDAFSLFLFRMDKIPETINKLISQIGMGNHTFVMAHRVSDLKMPTTVSRSQQLAIS